MYLVWIYAGLFFVVTGIHLYGNHFGKSDFCTATKPVILLTILGMYLEYMHGMHVDPSVWFVLALLTSWLGDVLLMQDGTLWFTAGGVTFGISHILFVIAYTTSGIAFCNIPIPGIVLPVLVYAGVTCFVFARLKPYIPGPLFIPMFLYLLANGVMNVFAWFRLLGGTCSCVSGCATVIGAILFFVSDLLLFLVRYDEKIRIKSFFGVMLTYSLGQFLITLGFMLSAV